MTSLISETLNLEMSRPSPHHPWVIWGGVLPAGGLKFLTFKKHLDAVGRETYGKGFVEISEGCTALALEYFAQSHNLQVKILCTLDGEKRLRTLGFKGKIITVHNIQEAFQICSDLEKNGWYWPRQMTNTALIDAVKSWAANLNELLRQVSAITTVVCGFGTGATAVGLKKALGPIGYDVIAVEAPPNKSQPGWRNYNNQNLGDTDLFYNYQSKISLKTATITVNQGQSALEVLLSQDYRRQPESVCIVSHDGVAKTHTNVTVNSQ